MRSSSPRALTHHRWLAQDNPAGELACADCGITIRTFEHAFDRIYDVTLTIAEQGSAGVDQDVAMDAVEEVDCLGASKCG